MTAEPSRAVLDRRDDGRGAVPHDDGAAPSTVENDEAVGLSSVGGLVRGLAFTLVQARPVRREATRLARDCARIARTTELRSGPSTFVLSNAGHVASLVNPPGNPKASYWAGGQPGPDPVAWKDSAEKRTGSWWEAWSAWVLERSGEETTAPAALGSDRHPPLEAAPGSYAHDRVPPAGRAPDGHPIPPRRRRP